MVAIIALNSKNRRNALERDRLARTYTAGASLLSIPELCQARAEAEQDPDLTLRLRADILQRYDDLIREKTNEARRAARTSSEPL